MLETMIKQKIAGWRWHLRQAGLLDHWFARYPDYLRDHCVKANPIRQVFQVDDLFHVKLEHASGRLKLIRNLFSPKAKREFKIGLELEAAGVPVTRHLGWGWQGGASMLLTETLSDAISAQSYWYDQIVYGSSSTTVFLSRFVDFIAAFLSSGFYHPDLHFGNILYLPSSKSFALVDVYGARRPRNGVSEQQQQQMRRNILFAMRHGIHRRQAIKLTMQLELADNAIDANRVWLDGLRALTGRINAEWPKRRRQLMQGYGKFILAKEVGSEYWLIRKNPGGTPCVDPLLVPDVLNGNNYDVIQMPSHQAEERWLNSFRLEMLGIDQCRPLVFEPPNLLYFERLSDGARPAPEELARDVVEEAEVFGSVISSDCLLMLPNGRIILRQ